MARYLIGKMARRDDLMAMTPDGVALEAGVFRADSVEFVGVPTPDCEEFTLYAPEPVDGRAEGWIYFQRAFGAYTEDLVAVRSEA